MLYATIFNVFLAAHDAEDYSAAGGLGIGLMIGMVIVAGVILSNLVISILGDTYDRWQESSAAEKLMLRAALCRDSKESWLRQIAQQLAKFLCTHAENGHKSLYVLVPASHAEEEEQGEWGGRLNKLKSFMKMQVGDLQMEMQKQNREIGDLKKQNEEILRAVK